MSDRIRWGPTGFGGFTGHVGGEGLEVFRLWRLDRDVTWILAADLPGESRYADDPDELKRAAEDWLAGFVSSLGAVFLPESPPTKRASRTALDFYRSAIEPAPSTPGTTAATAAGEKG